MLLLVSDALQAFDLSRVTASPAMVDMAKLTWINGQVHTRARARASKHAQSTRR